VEKGTWWRGTNSARVSSASASKMYRSGLVNPVSSRPAEALPPDRGQVGAEGVRHRVEDEIEAAVGEGAQVPHVAEHGPDGQAVPDGHLLVAGELPG
jgi:hypothetical protein